MRDILTNNTVQIKTHFNSTVAEQNPRERCGQWWKLVWRKPMWIQVSYALSTESIYSLTSCCWSCHSQCALQLVSPAARWPLSLIRTPQSNARWRRLWAPCIIHRSETHSAACVSLTHTHCLTYSREWGVQKQHTQINRCTISRMGCVLYQNVAYSFEKCSS